MLIRDQGRYRLTNCSRHYRTLVNDKLIDDKVVLADQDVISFLPDKDPAHRKAVDCGELYCQWRFSLPVAGSTTASSSNGRNRTGIGYIPVRLNSPRSASGPSHGNLSCPAGAPDDR